MPKKSEWEDKILFLETSEDEVEPDYIEYYLRNLIAQGIIDEINGIVIENLKTRNIMKSIKKCIKD